MITETVQGSFGTRCTDGYCDAQGIECCDTFGIEFFALTLGPVVLLSTYSVALSPNVRVPPT